ncbi:MFS transporter [Geitlerinema sp. PCC 9228]|uniref:MFS transporter n=1 Tax=Geitlerinema sp. PCC 9228 TaxID=111611 RepID=UPI0008F9A4C4|nr:MFS transporter [Geitlerinema sp. PCC 9228]
MEAKNVRFGKGSIVQRLLEGVNLRPEEGERTLLMFAFSTATSVGLIWLEASTVGLFLDRYGAQSLPWIYIAGALITSLLGFLYSWLQYVLSLRWAIVTVAATMAIPLLFFSLGLKIAGMMGVMIFLMRLWLDALYVMNDINTSITVNQLFNIREIKRTYPLVSSGILVADVLSGFSLPFLIGWFGVDNIPLISFLMLLVGAVVLFYVGQSYQQFFPDSKGRYNELEDEEYTNRRMQEPVRKYAVLVFAFFICAEVLYLLVDFQFLSELEQQSRSEGSLATNVASFLGLFNGIIGIGELAMQWFASSRIIERFGVFITAALLPVLVCVLGGISMMKLLPLFVGLILLKFFDDLLHYTLVESTGAVLFQPIPDNRRSRIQAWVTGVAEPVFTGVTGVAILGVIWGVQQVDFAALGISSQQLQEWIFLIVIVFIALLWLGVIYLLRNGYVSLLVFSAQRERLGTSNVDMGALKQAVIKTLDQPGTESEKRSCIELLNQFAPKEVPEMLAPRLTQLPTALQQQSLEVMLQHPELPYVESVRGLMKQSTSPEVVARALRYIWLTEKSSDLNSLRPYLRPEVDPVVRATAASMILRDGTKEQKAEATNTIRRMLTHKNERERVMGCRALGDADYLQALRLHIPNLLQDESLRVRCALLEVIASTRYEEYYPSLLRGLYYKSTREAAMQALVKLGSEILDRLVELAQDVHKPDIVRMYAWSTIGKIGNREAIDALVSGAIASWGVTRRNILQVLLKMPQEAGIEGVAERLGRSGVELLIDQELMLLAQVYMARLDTEPDLVASTQAESGDSMPIPDGKEGPYSGSRLMVEPALTMLRDALAYMEKDAIERIFWLMKFLYPISSIQGAAFNLNSGSVGNMAKGLEILDNVLDISSKGALLKVLDKRSDEEKVRSLNGLVRYDPLSPSDRLRHLLERRYFLSDWCLACCFHVAVAGRWSLTAEQTLAGLRHPRGFVREAVLGYLKMASPGSLVEVLPKMKNDSDPLVAAQVRQMMAEFKGDGSTSSL